MAGATDLVITTGAGVKCVGSSCSFLKGADPKTISFEGVKHQVEAFAAAAGGTAGRRVILLSTMGTTQPDNNTKDGQAMFYSLNGEVFVMASGFPFTVVKACGLGNGPRGDQKLLVGREDTLFASHPQDYMIA